MSYLSLLPRDFLLWYGTRYYSSQLLLLWLRTRPDIPDIASDRHFDWEDSQLIIESTRSYWRNETTKQSSTWFCSLNLCWSPENLLDLVRSKITDSNLQIISKFSARLAAHRSFTMWFQSSRSLIDTFASAVLDTHNEQIITDLFWIVRRRFHILEVFRWAIYNDNLALIRYLVKHRNLSSIRSVLGLTIRYRRWSILVHLISNARLLSNRVLSVCKALFRRDQQTVLTEILELDKLHTPQLTRLLELLETRAEIFQDQIRQIKILNQD